MITLRRDVKNWCPDLIQVRSTFDTAKLSMDETQLSTHYLANLSSAVTEQPCNYCLINKNQDNAVFGRSHKESIKEILAKLGLCKLRNKLYKVVCKELFTVCGPLQMCQGPSGGHTAAIENGWCRYYTDPQTNQNSLFICKLNFYKISRPE